MHHSKTSRARLAGGAVIAAAAVAVALVGTGSAATAAPGGKNTPNGPTIDIQLLSFNDFHGNLEPPAGSGGRLVIGHTRPVRTTEDRWTSRPVTRQTADAGGVEYLATHLAQAARGTPLLAHGRRR